MTSLTDLYLSVAEPRLRPETRTEAKEATVVSEVSQHTDLMVEEELEFMALDAVDDDISRARNIAQQFTRKVTVQDNIPQRCRLVEPDGYIHVSSLASICARQYALYSSMTDDSLSESVSSYMRLVWAYGRAAEAHIRGQYLADMTEEDEVIGEWVCSCGKQREEGTLPMQSVCGSCGKPSDQYRELTLRDDDLMIVGNPDFMIRRDGLITVFEFKSAGAKFKTISETNIDSGYLIQIKGYYELCKKNNMPVSKYGVFTFIDKAFVFGNPSPYKNIVVDLEESSLNFKWGVIVDELKKIKRWRETGKLPPKEICGTRAVGDAAGCRAAGRCFSE